MLNNQEYITTEIEKILLKSVLVSRISEKLKDHFTDATEGSKIKRIYRFFSTSTINPE